MNIEPEQHEGELTDILDAVGNTISIGNLLHIMDDEQLKMAIGTVKSYTPAGIINKGAPAQLRVIIDITMMIHPGVKILKKILRVPDPKKEKLLSDAMNQEPRNGPLT